MLQDFTKIPFDIIVQAGQSNSDGYGYGPCEDPYQPDDRVWYMNRDDTISMALEIAANNGVRSNFALSFVREYIAAGRLKEGRRIIILRAAVGGTAFSDNRWGVNDDLFLHMMEMIRTALDLNPENRLVALLWHQGETDAQLHASYEKHYKNLSTLVGLVRDTYDAQKLPFIAGDFVQHWKCENFDICTPVVNAIRGVCRDVGFAGFVESDGLKSNTEEGIEHPYFWPCDKIHFSRRSLYELGKRYFKKFEEIAE